MLQEIPLVEAAALLRVPYHTAHRYALTGRLTAIQRNGRWLVDRASVTRLADELAREQSVTARPASTGSAAPQPA